MYPDNYYKHTKNCNDNIIASGSFDLTRMKHYKRRGDMNAWLAFFIGMFIGTLIGVVAMACCAAAGKMDDIQGTR